MYLKRNIGLKNLFVKIFWCVKFNFIYITILENYPLLRKSIYDYWFFCTLLRKYNYNVLKILPSAKQNFMWLNKKFYMMNKQILLLPIYVLFEVLLW